MRASKANTTKAKGNVPKPMKMPKDRSTSMIEILKPPADLRAYRVVILPNGITAMLISEAFYYPSSKKSSSCNAEEMEVEEYTKDELHEGEAAAALCVGIGSFSDVPDIPGFAHFMEHMVFMGSKKFPRENLWDEFLAKNRGESNAWTDCERTCFYFVVQQSEFSKAMNIFANFFISPLFNKDSVDREIMAVDNECQMNATNDSERSRGIISHELVEDGHPMKKFTAGNKKSLKDDPEEKKLNIYEQLHSFYERMYSAHYMTLVVHSMESLDKIESEVIKIFSKIPNNNIPRPKFIKPPFQEKSFNKLLKIVPIEDVQKMEIVWALPPLMDHYRARVVEFLSLLLGHEGKGSILSILRQRHLGLEMKGGNDMTGYTHNSTWTALSLYIKLTDAGMQSYQEVLEIVYQYIALIKTEIPAYVFEEQRHIEETNYIFKQQDHMYNYVEELAENMHMFPPEHYLCGRSLYFEYNEQLLRDCLDCLRPQGMLVMLYDKAFRDTPMLREEPWLAVKYSISDLQPKLLQQLNNLPKVPELSLPDPNPYIATNFKLVTSKVKKTTKNPVVVFEEQGCRMWYKKDTTFHTPTVFVYFNFVSAAISKNEISLVLADIFLTCLLQKLTESLYSATLAGYEYYVDGTPEGVVFSINGYSEKIQLVIENTMKAFKDLNIEEHTFNYMKTHLRQLYMNDLIKPVELARAVRCSVTEQLDPSLLLRYEQMGSLDYKLFQQFMKDFYDTMFIECLATGNMKPQEAVEMAKMVKAVIKKPLKKEDIKKPTVLQLVPGNSKCFMSAVNKEDTNSCVIQYFQQGPGTIKNVLLNEILTSAMSEPLFNSLRTEKQLAYSVYCYTSNTHGVLGFSVVVESQANKFTMKEVDEHITKFLLEFNKLLEAMPMEKITEMIEDQAIMRTYGFGDLYEQSHYYWEEIVGQTYLFKRRDLELAACQGINRQDLLDWGKALLDPNRRQLSLLVEGCTKAKCEMATGHSSLASISGLIKGIRTCMPGGKAKAGCTDNTCGEGASESGIIQPQDQGQGYITNLCQFKTSLSPMKHHVIIE